VLKAVNKLDIGISILNKIVLNHVRAFSCKIETCRLETLENG